MQEHGPSVGAVSYGRAAAGSVAARALHDAPRGHAYDASKGSSFSSPRVQSIMLLEVAAMMDLEALVMRPPWLLDMMHLR